MAESVEMKLPREPILVIEPTEMPRESVRVHQFTALIREHIIAHLKAALLRLIHFAVAVAAKDSGHLLADVNRPG